MKKKKQPDKLLTKKDLLQRGWNGRKIFHLLPKPIYQDNTPLWKLSDVERIESSVDFYLFDEVD